MARTYKCKWCGTEISKEERYKLEYLNRNGILNKYYGHEHCASVWYKDFVDYNDLDDTLLQILDVPTLSKSFIQRLRQLRSKYTYEVMQKTVVKNKKQIVDNFDKGWNYIFAIINNSIPQVYKAEQKKEERIITEEKNQEIYVIDNSKMKKIDTTDYSKILD